MKFKVNSAMKLISNYITYCSPSKPRAACMLWHASPRPKWRLLVTFSQALKSSCVSTFNVIDWHSVCSLLLIPLFSAARDSDVVSLRLHYLVTCGICLGIFAHCIGAFWWVIRLTFVVSSRFVIYIVYCKRLWPLLRWFVSVIRKNNLE